MGLKKHKLEAIRAITKSRFFTVITDKEAIVAGDMKDDFDRVLASVAIRNVRKQLKSILDRWEKKPTARGKPETKPSDRG